MKSRRIWIILAAVVCLGLIGVFALGHFFNADTYRGRIESALSKSLHRRVRLGHLSFSIFTGDLSASSLSIANKPSFSSRPFLTAQQIDLGVKIWPLIFHHRLDVTSITVDHPSITLLRRANGAWSYTALGGAGHFASSSSAAGRLLPHLSVNRLTLKDGTVTVGNLPSATALHVYSHVNVTARHFSLAKAFPFTVSADLPGGGSMRIQGDAGPIKPDNAAGTPLTAKLTLSNARLSREFLSSSQGISGLADLDGYIQSNGRTATVTGKLRLTRLKLAQNGQPSSQPVSVQFTGSENLQSLSGNIHKADLSIGKAVMSVTGAYRMQHSAVGLHLHAVGQKMPIDSLVAFLPSLGVRLPSGSQLRGGTLTTSLDITGTPAQPVITGPVQIVNTRLTGFNLGKKLSAIQALAGAGTGSNTTIQLLSADLHHGPAGTRTNHLTAVVTGVGTATGSGSISPSGALDYHLKVKLASSGLGGLAQRAASMLPGVFGARVGQSLKNGVPVTIRGTTAHPVFKADLGKVLGAAPRQTNQKTQPKQTTLQKALGKLLGSASQP